MKPLHRLLVISATTASLFATGRTAGRDLSFQERVEAQRAIERVYYSHQIGATLPFENAVPDPVLEHKVRTYLKQSVALDRIWHTPITAETLRAEWKRISRDTRFPDRLREIAHALGDDPILIQECFIRGVLADRLTRELFASDRQIHEAARREAEALRNRLAEGALDPRQEDPSRRIVQWEETEDAREEFLAREQSLGKEGSVGDIEETRENFSISVVMKKEPRRISLAVYEVKKAGWESWWADKEERFSEASVRMVEEAAQPLLLLPDTPPRVGFDPQSMPVIESNTPANVGCIPADSWTRGLAGDLPDARSGHTAVWTGTEMIVWGGSSLARGNRYDPVTNTWRDTTSINAPEPRSDHTAVWTGSRMVIWGGRVGSELNTGGRYDPITDSWSAVSTVGAPSPRRYHTAVWTGSRMIVWGGGGNSFFLGDGGRYDPATDTWSGMSASGLAPRYYHSAVWTGAEMIVWGGQSDPGGNTIRADGAWYNPVTNQWSNYIPFDNGPANRRRHTAIWTGSRMIIWGGDNITTAFNDGKIYNPSNPFGNKWTAMSSFSIGRTLHKAVWTGSKMIIWGGQAGSGSPLNTGGVYDSSTNLWQPMSTTGAPAGRAYHSMIWTGNRVIVWGGLGGVRSFRDGGRYDPQTDSWTPTSILLNGPSAGGSFGMVWTGTQMVVWGGRQPSPELPTNTGARYDPLTDTWTPTSLTNAPVGRRDFSAAWTGSRMVIWGGIIDNINTMTNTGGRYDPITDSWSPTSVIGAPQPKTGTPAVWTGSHVIIWGSVGGSPSFDGWKYDPLADAWMAISTQGQPEGRDGYSMVWTGARVVVWGGRSRTGPQPLLNTGGRYNPSNDQWTNTSTTGAPPPMGGHQAVWTGDRMLVWGGPGFGGGRYNPQNDSWTSLSSTGGPSALFAVWTGTEMIAWGSPSSAGRYDPVVDQWTPITGVGAPPSSSSVRGVWSGQFMLVWGWAGFNFDSNPGGVYAPYQVSGDRDGDGFQACSGDCDDSEASVHPGAAESCNGRDDDCDGVLDNGFPDLDGDGYAACAGDCNDTDAPVHPGVPESCNGIDDNCNGLSDEGLAAYDLDGDGYLTCGNLDCDDTRGTVYAGAPQLCDGINNDCSAPGWPAVPASEMDVDGDLYLACAECDDTNVDVRPGGTQFCDGLNNDCNSPSWPSLAGTNDGDDDGDGVAECTGDCNDANAAVRPGGPQICDGVNNDCSATAWPSLAGTNDGDDDGDGVAECTGDCNDANGAVRPGGPQICDGVNNDCSAPGWPAVPASEMDADGDLYIACAECDDTNVNVRPGGTQFCDGLNNDCSSPNWPSLAGTNEADDDLDGVTECSGDCNDANGAVRPGGLQICDGVNNDCSAPGWPSLAGTNDGDDDGDGAAECTGDCNDASVAVRPGAAQICDGLNNDCSAPGWPGLAGTNEGDDDGDSVSECQGDCNDADVNIYPSAPEINDGVDNECPSSFGYGTIDEISGSAGFLTPGDSQEFSWPPQAGSNGYQVQRSSVPYPSGSPFLVSTLTTAATWSDTVAPPSGTTFYYLVRSTGPHVGSWGARSNGQERTGFFSPEALCDDSIDNDTDGLTDCSDPDCLLAPNCPPAAYSFIDTAGDDVSGGSLSAFFSSISPGAGDFLYVSLAGPGLTDLKICAERADFYRDSYLALAVSGGMVFSGSWNRWTLQEGGTWIGPITSAFENDFGASCGGSHSWCPEQTLAGRVFAVLPENTDQCETLDGEVGCGSGTWQLDIKVGHTRLDTCGF